MSFNLLKSTQKRLTLLGMSGIGKTHLSKLLSCEGGWYHYSGDYRIGAKYLNDAILDNIKQQIRQDGYLAELLDNHSISVKNHITFDNLSSMSSFLGKVGNPELGGLPIDEFSRRQALFKQAERGTMLDVEKFIKKSQTQGYSHFINDAGGSLCELDDDKVYQSLADNTLIVYIRANQSNEEALIKRAQTHPKPLYYQRDFIQQQLAIYLQKNQLTYVAQINPDSFARWVFPQLLKHRKPKYAAIADKYGCSIDAQDLHQCKNADEVMALLTEAIR